MASTGDITREEFHVEITVMHRGERIVQSKEEALAIMENGGELNARQLANLKLTQGDTKTQFNDRLMSVSYASPTREHAIEAANGHISQIL